MQGSEYMINLLGLAGMITIISLALVFTSKMQKLKQLQTTVDKLKRSLDEMDEQAKLVVRTDMELNKIQEELDKKITGLYALQRLSRTISTTLEENQVFKRIESGYFEDLGFEKALAFLWNAQEKKILAYLNIGYLEEEIRVIKSFVDSRQDVFLSLIKNEKSLSSISLSKDIATKERINHAFQVNSFVISPILPKEGNKGFLFVGTSNIDTLITEGDEELITILANQIGQALENARLFEKTWRAQQDLEIKVEERTHQLTLVLDEVKKISKRKTDFVSSVSHELRTPLTSIKGFVETLLEGALDDKENSRSFLRIIQGHSGRLESLVDDLLSLSSLESQEAILKKESFSARQKLQEVILGFRSQLKKKNIEIHNELRDDVLLTADKDRMQQVFTNLVDNAIKFNKTGGFIKVSAERVDGKIKISIEDSGSGIPANDIPRIFERFYRVDKARSRELGGTGLGLSIVKHIIELHNGSVGVESTEGLGSKFWFILP